uniref:Uncharacterized protein n=1 Tax=Romanomermis culicivorax TaxID=13658 RepID=A0A915K2X0_ROMCU
MVEFKRLGSLPTYHSPNEYYDSFLHWINQQANDTDKMLLAFSKHFHRSRILELGGDGKWYETDAYCDATLLNVPHSE